MKRLLTLFLLLCAATITAFAQMSDDQVIEYVKTQNEAGVSQQQIAVDLLKKGVPREQLTRIRQQLSNERGNSNTNTNQSNDDRSRKPNSFNANDYDNSLLYDYALLEQEQENTRKIFGHDIFKSKNLSFEPNMNIATPASYVLGPGDEVIIDVYGASQVTQKLKISPDGQVVVPKIGPIYVSGLTVDQAQRQVRSKMGGHYEGSTIKLTIGQTRSVIVNVMGEVNTPGTYTLSAFSTVFNALYMAGGVTDIGTLRAIKVSRNGRIISTVDVYEFITSGRLVGNVMLQDNDVIIVGPYENLVEVTGRVKRPMLYEMKKNESLQTAISFAGGFTGGAFKEKIRVQRTSHEGLSVHNIDEWDFNSFILEDEDVVTVDSILDRYHNMVIISGAIFRPGKYKLDGNVNSLKTLITQAGGLTEQAFTNRAVVQRLKEDRTRKIVSINLRSIMDGTSPDFMLQNEDSVVIASMENDIKGRTVLIDGPVFNPGHYPYAENETVEDLIIRAGGLKENATLADIQVSRRYLDKDGNENYDQLAKIFNITIKDGLPIEDGSGLTLMPYDIVSIHVSPDYHTQQSATIFGEIKYAGLYILANKNERISDLVKRSGGLTAKAYPRGARLIRYLNSQEKALQEELIAMNNRDSLFYNMEISDRYSVGINLEEALKNPGSDYDLILRSGDELTIPTQKNIVRINGEVLRPNTVAYIKGKKASYYINEAGGYKRSGDKHKTYILYANGQISRLSKGKIEPGCEIIVPTKEEKKSVDPNKVSQWVSVSSALATVAAVIVSITR